MKTKKVKTRILARLDDNEDWLVQEIDKIAKKEYSSRSTIVKQAMSAYIINYKEVSKKSKA
jgi:metal-responsive CopG/Arc/MetJ family transcriptional regulator